MLVSHRWGGTRLNAKVEQVICGAGTVCYGVCAEMTTFNASTINQYNLFSYQSYTSKGFEFRHAS